MNIPLLIILFFTLYLLLPKKQEYYCTHNLTAIQIFDPLNIGFNEEKERKCCV